MSSPFSLLVTFGAVLGLGCAAWIAPREKSTCLGGGMGILALSLLGARVEHVLLHWRYFSAHVVEIPQVWLGGLGWVGAFSGGLLGMGGLSWIWKKPFGVLMAVYLPLAGFLALGVGMVSPFGGLGYGPQTSAWWGLPIPDEFGVYADRWPIHFLGGVLSWALVMALALPARGVEWFSSPGRRGSAGLWLAALLFTAVSALRVDPGVFIHGLRFQTWGGLVLSLTTFILFIYNVRYPHEDKHPPG